MLALFVVLALVAGACASQDDGAGDDAQGAQEPQQGGTLTWASEQFPPHLQCERADNNLAWCSYPQKGALLGAFDQTPDFEYVPELVEEAEVDEGPPFVVTFHINPDAQWSDGTPVSADDFEYTYQLHIDKKAEVVSRDGYDDVESSEVVDDKTFELTFKEPFAPYRVLFDPLYPAHVLEGEDWNKVWNKCVCDPETGEPIGSGPYLITEFRENQSITLEPNENWWGEGGPYLDSMVWRHIPDTNSEIEALRGQEVDAIFPSFQIQLEQVLNLEGVETQIVGGPTWQHLDFQVKQAPLLGEVWMRQAIAYGIDREAIVEELLRGVAPDAEVLNSVIYVNNQPEYEPHFEKYSYDPDQARQLLEDNGCTEGSDGIYECNGEKASFAYKSTAGNQLRELQFQIIQDQLKDVGIEVTNAFGEADVVFTELTEKDYELFQFAWVGNIDPFTGNTIFQCGGDQNYQDLCNEEASELISQTVSETDPEERAAMYNEADALMAEDVQLLPLWQVPQPLQFHDSVHELQANATTAGPIWNAEHIWVESEGQ